MSVQHPTGADNPARDDPWHQQDWQPATGHARNRWQERVLDPGRYDQSISVAWREAEPIEYDATDHDGDYVRYHVDAGIILIAECGLIQTIIRIEDRNQTQQSAILRQVRGEPNDE